MVRWRREMGVGDRPGQMPDVFGSGSGRVRSPSDSVAGRGPQTLRADQDRPVTSSPRTDAMPSAAAVRRAGGPLANDAHPRGAQQPLTQPRHSPARPRWRVDMPDDRPNQAVTPPAEARTRPPVEATRRRFIAATAAASGAAVVGGLVAGSPASAAEAGPGSRVSTTVAGVQGPTAGTRRQVRRPGPRAAARRITGTLRRK